MIKSLRFNEIYKLMRLGKKGEEALIDFIRENHIDINDNVEVDAVRRNEINRVCPDTVEENKQITLLEIANALDALTPVFPTIRTALIFAFNHHIASPYPATDHEEENSTSSIEIQWDWTSDSSMTPLLGASAGSGSM